MRHARYDILSQMLQTTHIQVNMDIFLKFGLFGHFNSMGGPVDILLIFLILMGELWLLSDY